jgi:primosomal protein N' (replication factor Y)
VTLSERFGEARLPAIEIIDVKQIIQKEKSKVMLSPQLKAAIEASLGANRQSILFQNRRGYFPYQVCAACGWIPQCKNCDVSLTFHKLTNKLVCHYCGTVYSIVNTCAACGSHQFIQKNFGTEKIEEHLDEVFPKAKVARMDIDAVRGKHAHDNLIQQFEQRRIDILVGTQMVVKGLDFEHVNLVGILDADSLLNFVDFRVNERAFQLMEQVSGRAGRKSEEGRVLIQVSNTRHPVLQFVQQHNYKAFFEFEIEGRERFFYPPFSRLILLSFRHKQKETATNAAMQFASLLHGSLGKYIIGPTEPVISRVRNQFRMELLLKLPKDSAFINRTKSFIREQIAVLQQQKAFRPVVIIIDVDPV